MNPLTVEVWRVLSVHGIVVGLLILLCVACGLLSQLGNR